MVLLAITREDRLEASSITHVVESVVKTSLLGGVVDLVGSFLEPVGDDVIISRANPLNNLGVAEVDLRGVQTQGVSAARFGGLHPVGADGLPVELDGGDVGGGDLLVQLGELVEESLVDDGDSLEQFLVGCSLDGTGDEDVTGGWLAVSGQQWVWFLLDSVNHHRSSLSGKVTDSLEVKGAAHSRDVGEWLENLGVAGVVTVVEQDHRGESSLTGHKGGHHVSLGVVDVGCVGSSSLLKSVTHLAIRNSHSYSQELVNVLGRHGVRTSPNLARLDSLQIESSNDSKVATSALQSPEQVLVARLVGLDDGAIGEDNLVVDNGVTAEADLVAVEVDTASEEQSRDTDGAKATTSGGKVELLQIGVDIAPAV